MEKWYRRLSAWQVKQSFRCLLVNATGTKRLIPRPRRGDFRSKTECSSTRLGGGFEQRRFVVRGRVEIPQRLELRIDLRKFFRRSNARRHSLEKEKRP